MRKITCVSDLIDGLKADLDPDGTYWFRGQESHQWPLLPSLVRRPSLREKEAELIGKFKQNAALLLANSPQSEWDWMMIMQHHGVPTRLLDWTESPLIGLYFALDTLAKDDGALWILQPLELNRLSNIYPINPVYIPSFDDDLLSNYKPSVLAGEQMTSLRPIAVIGTRNTTRMQAQLGVFTVIHRDITPLEQIGNGNHVWKYEISFDMKSEIRKELALLGIGRFQLFPELQSLGQILKEL